MNVIELSSTVRRDPDLISADMDGETVMMSIENGKYYGLVGVGPFVWEELNEPISIGALAKKITDAFDVDEKICQADVLALVTDLHSRNIVKLA